MERGSTIFGHTRFIYATLLLMSARILYGMDPKSNVKVPVISPQLSTACTNAGQPTAKML